MPFVAYVHAQEPGPEPGRRPPWEPNWRLWRWVAAAAIVGFASAHAEGFVGALLVFVAFGLGCRALGEAFPYGDGLREWRQ